MKKIVVFTLSMFLLFACAKKEERKGAYLAKVGNVEITQADFERELKGLPDFAQKMFEGSSGKEKFLDELIKKEMLYQEAVKRGLEKDTGYLKKVDDFKKITLIGLLLEKEIEAKAKVSEQEVKEYYEKHKEEFTPVSQIRVSHILVKTEKEARDILQKLKKGGDFSAIAKKSSIDTATAKNGGDLGFISKGQMVQEFEAAAVKLKVGEISEPVQTKFGYHIIKVTDKKMGPAIEFNRVKDMVLQHLSAEKQRESFDSYMDTLRKSYKVEINKEELLKLTPTEEKKDLIQEKPQQTGKPKETKETQEKKK